MSDKTEYEKEIEKIIDGNFIDDEHTIVHGLVYKARQDERQKVISEYAEKVNTLREWIKERLIINNGNSGYWHLDDVKKKLDELFGKEGK